MRLPQAAVTRAQGTADREEGAALAVWLLMLLPVLLAFAGLVLDGGRAISARQDAANLAEQAARSAVDQLAGGARNSPVGAQFLQLDPGAANSSACGYVAGARPGALCSTTIGSDGQVQVTVTIKQATAILRAIGVSQLTASGNGQARPAFGATQEVPQ